MAFTPLPGERTGRGMATARIIIMITITAAVIQPAAALPQQAQGSTEAAGAVEAQMADGAIAAATVEAATEAVIKKEAQAEARARFISSIFL